MCFQNLRKRRAIVNCNMLNLYRSGQWRCSANYLFCSYQEAKFRHVARKLNIFEERLLGGLFVHFNDFFRDFSYRTLHNFARKQIFLAEHIKILLGSLEINQSNISQIVLQNTSLSVKQTEVC